MQEVITPQSIWGPVFIVVAVVGIAVVMMLSVRAKIARRNKDRPSPREWIEHVKAVRHRPEDLAAGQAKLVETARRLAAQLDNKAGRLELLIQQADERIARLPRTGDGTEPEAPGGEPAPGKTIGQGPVPAAPDTLTSGVYELADAGRSPVEIAQQLDEQVGKVELILALRNG